MPAELLERMGADILAKCERRWPKWHHELGPCQVWHDGEPTIKSAGNVYGRQSDATLQRSDAAHRVVWRRVYSLIPKGPNGKPLEVDHKRNVALCHRPDHLRLLTKRQKRGRARADAGAE